MSGSAGTVKLISLRVVADGHDADGSNGARKALPHGEGLPKRLKVLKWGENKTLKGTYVVDEGSVAVFAANQARIGRERVALDFEHNTVPGSEEFSRTKEPRDVAGYWTAKLVPGEGIFLEAPDWTPLGKEKALNYEDLSATPFVDGDRVIGLHSVALTRAGASEFTFFSAGECFPSSDADPSPRPSPLGGAREKKEQSDFDNKNMNANENKGVVITLADLAGALGLPATASETETFGKLSTLATLSAEVPGLREALQKAAKKEEPLTLSATIEGKVVTFTPAELVGKVVSMEKANEDLRKATTEAERGQIVQRLAAEGRVPLGGDGKALSDEALRTLNVDTLKILLANTPVTVPLSARGRVTSEAAGSTRERSKAEIRRQMAVAIAN